jgi:hypothetical protein
MEPPTTGQEAIGHDESPVHNWRVSQLKRLGVPGPLAEIYADRSTGIRWPGWCGAAVPRGSPSASSADATGEGATP